MPSYLLSKFHTFFCGLGLMAMDCIFWCLDVDLFLVLWSCFGFFIIAVYVILSAILCLVLICLWLSWDRWCVWLFHGDLIILMHWDVCFLLGLGCEDHFLIVGYLIHWVVNMAWARPNVFWWSRWTYFMIWYYHMWNVDLSND